MILIETTNICNLKCPYCARSTNGLGFRPSHKGERHMTFDEFDYIIKELVRAKIRFGDTLYLHGFGEPLLNPSFGKIIHHPLLRHWVVRFNSNATVMTDKMAENLVTSNLYSITFSLQSSQKEIMEQLQKGLKFERAIKNIRKLIKRRDETNSKLVIAIIHLRTKLNMNEVVEDFQKAIGEDLNGRWLFTRKEINTHCGQASKWAYDNLLYKPPIPRSCHYGQTYIINVYGDLCPCCTDTSRVQTYGNMFEEKINVLLNENTNLKLKKLRNELKQRDFTNLPICKECIKG